MNIYKYIRRRLLLVLVVCIGLACNHEELLLDNSNKKSSIIFRPIIDQDMDSRAIGDATRIDELVTVVYEGTNNKRELFRINSSWAEVKKNGLSLTLMEGKKYSILFWAHDDNNSAYTITNAGTINVSYDNYQSGGFCTMEQLDAFYGISEIKVKEGDNKTIQLSRPLAQVNFADNATKPIVGTHKAVVTFHNIPTSFNPFTGVVTKATNDMTFTFTDFPNEELLKLDGISYYYVSSNYLFAPTHGTSSVEATLDLQNKEGSSINHVEFKDEKSIVLEKNKKTNVLGSIIQKPIVWSAWDGNTPEIWTLTRDEQNRYIIDEATDIAWLSEKGATLSTGSVFMQTIDINMAGKPISSIQLPAGSTYDGGNKQIINYSNSLFGNATKVSVKNLTIDKASVPSNGIAHTGVLLNTLTGSATFENITITNSSATTTNGAAGGFIGYIKNNGTETLEVNFTKCTATNNIVSGSLISGVYVGRFRGYNSNETLTFSADCNESSATFDSNAKTSYYTTDNVACWFTSAQITALNKYSGWLGCEEYYRGTVNYGSDRYIPKWDGITKIAPLTEGTTKLIYSAFDLANCAGTNPGSIKFMENVDLGAKSFNPLTNLSKLFGENKTIYNMKVETTFNTNSWDGGGFVRRCSAATIENITFSNADVKVTHVSGSDGDAYASIVCGTAEGTNTMTNVRVIGGKLYGCNKMGGIAGYITGTFTATNCIVDGLSIENYDSGGKDKLGFKANGEVGGAFGFIAANSTISGCYVKNTTLNCRGVDNGRVLVFFKYAGRHVNEFIGDIRTTSGQTINITYDANKFTGNSYKNRKDQYSGCKYIGHCYYTSINAGVAKIEDTKGKVNVNGNSISVAKNY